MTKLLDSVIEKARKLTEEEQDALAIAILDFIDTADNDQPEELDEETRAAIQEGLDQARRGEFVSEEKMAAFWKQFSE